MELMATLAIAAVLLGVGVPSFRDFMRNARLTGAANDLLITVVTARNEAVRRQAIVSVCPTTTPDTPSTATCTSGATEGWIAFVDTDGSCLRDGAEVADVQRNVVANMSRHSEVTTTKNGDCISFGANGFRRVVVGQPPLLRVLFCDSRGTTEIFPSSPISFARGLEVLPTGRASVSRLQIELNSWSPSCP